MNKIRRLYRKLISEEENIRLRLLNIVLLCLCFATIPAAIVTAIISHSVIIALPIILIFAITCFSLWLANVRMHSKLGGLVLGIVGNFVLFPAMYFMEGGMHSGMPIWILLGLIYEWLVLDGITCALMYLLNLVTMYTCIYIETVNPSLVIYLAGSTEEAIDISVALFIVSITLGLIYHYQAYAYEKQKKKIEERDEELTRAMIEVENANRAKSDFLANMSHEIRTPINAILGMNEMIQREAPNDEIKTYASNIESAGNTLMAIINDILDFSKIESGRMELVNVDYDLYSLVSSSYHSVATRAKSKHLSFQVRNNPGIPSRLYGDENRVRQVINNLLTNAVKYTSVGEVLLRLDFSKEGANAIDLIITVSDTGAGIKEEDQDRIFNNFQRVDEETNRNIEGTGLGLAIVKNVVELMEGSITVKSEYGTGSTFTIRIPQIVADEKPIGSISEKLKNSEIPKAAYKEKFYAPNAKILTVDDVKMNQDVVTMLLKKTGVKIDKAFSGRECLEAIQSTRYDAILMDHFMPEMDGIETFKKIKELAGNPNQTTPVVILTANAIAGAEENYISKGFAGYLSKPIKGKQLEEMLLKLLPDELIQNGAASESDAKAPSTEPANNAMGPGFSFLDIPQAMQYCAGSKELLLQSLKGFVSTDNFIKELEDTFDKDWKEYRVKMHAVKSSSMIIGAGELSGTALEIENALKDDDMEFARVHHADFIKEYKKLVKQIVKALKNYSE